MLAAWLHTPQDLHYKVPMHTHTAYYIKVLQLNVCTLSFLDHTNTSLHHWWIAWHPERSRKWKQKSQHLILLDSTSNSQLPCVSTISPSLVMISKFWPRHVYFMGSPKFQWKSDLVTSFKGNKVSPRAYRATERVWMVCSYIIHVW